MELLNDLFSPQHPLLAGLVLLVLIVLALYFSWSPWRQLFVHWRLHHLVNKLGTAAMKNVYIPDGLGDVIYIELLILQSDGLLFITIKPFRGNIFAAQQIDQWTQVVGHHSYKFPNPLHQQEADLQALRGMVDKQRVTGMVVFAKGSHFPKGKPDGVCDYEQLRRMGQSQESQEVNPQLNKIWDTLNSKAQPATNMKQSILFREGDRRSLVIGLLFSVLSVAFALWSLRLFTL